MVYKNVATIAMNTKATITTVPSGSKINFISWFFSSDKKYFFHSAKGTTAPSTITVIDFSVKFGV